MTIINDFVAVPNWVGIYLADGGSFSTKILPGLIVEHHDNEDDEFSTIMPSAFRPFGLGIEADPQAFDYLHKDDFARTYGSAKWDIANVQTEIRENEDEEFEPVTTFSILVTNGNELRVYDGIGFDSEVLPDSAKFVIAENQRVAIEEFKRGIEQ